MDYLNYIIAAYGCVLLGVVGLIIYARVAKRRAFKLAQFEHASHD